jgi:hypothetical protein
MFVNGGDGSTRRDYTPLMQKSQYRTRLGFAGVPTMPAGHSAELTLLDGPSIPVMGYKPLDSEVLHS